MTLRAACLAVEEFLPCRWIARHRRTFRLPLKNAEIFDQGFYRRGVEAAERRHAVGRNSICDDLRQRGVGAILSFGRRRNVGSAFATSTVESVATSAPIFKRLTSLGDRALILRWVTLRDGCTFDDERERGENDCGRDERDLFELERARKAFRQPRMAVASGEKKLESLATVHEHDFSDNRKISNCTRLLTS